MNVFLNAKTSSIGSECSVDMGVTEEEWGKMTRSEREQHRAEYMGDVLETWITFEEPQGK
ncbi:MAG: hypothetical protein Altm2KO_02690 [Alteromonas macleodii]